ncbi:MAG: hypothetical protein MR384_13390 [Lachnospiraceae bacterium]|nr:hypothetical protein [Lachnospiraceae bacterium]
MANTLLTTSRTLQATNNPQDNISQANNTQNVAEQPINSNVNGTQGINQSAQNSINPITIPIQIQPQVAQTSQPNNTNNISVHNLQTNNQQVAPAPTPQAYKEPTNTNTIDFNQIYSSYQGQYGNNSSNTSTYSSGIRKSSIGTTIVTPTTSNINSVEGQYQSAYADTVNGLISEMLTQMKNGFSYDPNQDNSLKAATEYAANSSMQSLAGSGVLNSSATAERVAKIVSDLIPTYEEKAHSRWTEYLGKLADTAQIVMNYDNQQFNYWKDAKDREFESKKFEYEKQQNALTNAWKRVDELGYVDNEASTILGVAVGTLSGEARQAKEQREYELQKMKEQADIEYQNNVALYKLKSQLDTEQSKTLTENEYKLKQKYGTTSSNSKNTTSLSTYKDIINNRYANYDDYSKKYTVSDNNSLYNYLVSEYSSGRLSANDLASLTAMYNVTQPTSSDTAKQERLKYLESLKKYQ